MLKTYHQADAPASGGGAKEVPAPPQWLTRDVSEGRPPAAADLREAADAPPPPASGSGEYRLPPAPAVQETPPPYTEQTGNRAPDFPGDDPFGKPPPPPEAPAASLRQEEEPSAPLPPPLPPKSAGGPLKISIGSGVDSPDAPASGDDFQLPFEDLPPPPPAADGAAVSQDRTATSEPKFRQMSIQELRAAQQKAEQEPADDAGDEDKPTSGKWQSSGIFLTSKVDEEDRALPPEEETAEERRLASLAGLDREEPLDAFGVPKRLPKLPARLEDSAAPARRVAGGTWVALGLLLLLLGHLADALQAITAVAVPVAVTGALLTTGKPWSGILGLLMAVILGIGGAAIGAMILAGVPALTDLTGMHLGGLGAGLGIIAFSILLILGNLYMLLGSPPVPKAAVAGVVLVFSFIGVLGAADLSDARVHLTMPTGPREATPYGSARQGFTFIKPDGWASYSWSQITGETPVGTGLVREPEYYFLNRAQNILVAFYTEESQRPTLAQLLGRDTPSPLEREIARGLPAAREDPDAFDFQGHHFSEMTYDGVLDGGESLAITVARTQLGQRSFYVVATRDARSRATQEDVEHALNAFYSRLELIPEDEDE